MSLPPAQPAYILRGHAAQIHSVSFIWSNIRLVTGDADGWIVIWSLATKRPVAVWRAHEGAILGARSWGSERMITHGKDNKLIVWKYSQDDEPLMSTVLPVATSPEPRKQPWLLHILHVNTMNFCCFAQCNIPAPTSTSSATSDELLIAVPNTMTSETVSFSTHLTTPAKRLQVDIFHLPSCKRIHTVSGDTSIKTGMVMAVSLFYHPETTHLTVAAGYESGHTTVSQLMPSKTWHVVYSSQSHTQPILSLDISPSRDFYLTSSADAVIAKHPIPTASQSNTLRATPLKTQQTRHSGQQGLKIRNDGLVFATAGWDSRARVYAAGSLKELAVLKWHKEGCYAVAFADVKLEDEGGKGGDETLVAPGGKMTVREERLWKAKTSHWLAVGSKDGKVSLWDIY